jgi:gliding motility-associated-like protein
MRGFLAYLIIALTVGTVQGFGQIRYVGKACILNPNASTGNTGGTNTGNGSSNAQIPCVESTFLFDHTPGGKEWEWNFDNGSITTYSGANNHTFTSVGTHTVGLTVKDANGAVLANKTATVQAAYYPAQPLFAKKMIADTTICDGKTITLDPFKDQSRPSNVTYKWFPNGETDPTIDVSESGCYSVEVIDNVSGCSRSAKINVKVCLEQNNAGGSAEKWYFGQGSGMEFNIEYATELEPDSLANEGSLDPQPELEDPSYQPTVPRSSIPVEAPEAVAMVYDKNGSLALYTDGKKIYSGEDDAEITYTNGNPLANLSGTQGLAIVPKPVCSSCDFINYYVFFVDKTTGLLQYSVVDMRENSRKGAVVGDPVPVAAGIADKIAVERYEEQYLISAYVPSSGNFQSISVDSLGLISLLPPHQIPAPTARSTGYVSVSANGNAQAHGLIINGENTVEIFTRDPETGALSGGRTIDLNITAGPEIYGLAFSPNGQFLYISLKGNGTSIPSSFLQLDISSGTLVELASSNTDIFGAVALGPKYGAGEKYVYLTIEGKRNVHYLQAPDEAGAATAFTYTQPGNPGVDNIPGTTGLGFPNIVAAEQDQQSDGIGADYSGNCFGTSTVLTAQKVCSPMENEFEWIVEGQKYKGEQISHIFSRTGWHDVKLTIKIFRKTQVGNSTGSVTGNLFNEHCSTVDFEGKVYIKPSPEYTVPFPLYLCDRDPFKGVTVNIDPKGGDSFTYEWLTIFDAPIHSNNKEKEILIEALSSSGTFKVKVSNNYNCTTETVFPVEPGCVPRISIPNVFTPNGDGTNDVFEVKPYFISRPVLEIYNRWGEQVFQTDNLDIKWDGSYKGKIYSPQMYAYVLKYYEEDFPEKGEQKKVGSVMVITN